MNDYVVYQARYYNIFAMKSNVIRIAVVGDDGVGKTSLVCAIISDLTAQVPKVHKKVVLPPDMCAYSKDIFTELVDTASTSDLQTEIKLSDLVLLVYDVSSQESIVRLKEHWLPIIHQINKEIPVVIVGNKCDKVELPIDEKEEYTPVRDVLKGLIKSYRQVQIGIECSAYYDKKVKPVLNSAQRAVLYPLGPLYDLATKEITQKFRKALLRIFRILDTEMTGSLSDTDLTGLQQRVFQTQLSSQDIRAIKNIIQKQCREEQSNSISEQGFVAFQKKCIEMLKIQICWSILRHFDYNNLLEIKAFDDSFVINQASGESLELSPQVLDFLNRAYVFAQKADPRDPMRRLFEPSPSIYMQEFLEENIDLERFTLLWQLFAFINYRECYRALLYIGYDRKLQDCFIVTRGKTTYSDLLKLKERKIYSILFVDDKDYSSSYSTLFENSKEEGVLTRAVKMYSSETISKVLVLFRIRDFHLRTFLQQEGIAKQIDLIVHFQSQKSHLTKRDLALIPPHVMVKYITRDMAENKLQLFAPIQIDLNSVPVRIKWSPAETLLHYLVHIFSNIQQGFKPEHIQILKNESKKFKKMLVGVASVLTFAALGFVAYTKKLR